jgi:hypothetical protein
VFHRYPQCTAYVFSYSLGRVFLIFFDINWTKNGYLSQRRLLVEGKNCAAAFRKLPMFHQSHKCLPYFSIKKWYWGRKKYWISFQLIFCTAAVLGLLEASRKKLQQTGRKLRKEGEKLGKSFAGWKPNERKNLGKNFVYEYLSKSFSWFDFHWKRKEGIKKQFEHVAIEVD